MNKCTLLGLLLEFLLNMRMPQNFLKPEFRGENRGNSNKMIFIFVFYFSEYVYRSDIR